MMQRATAQWSKLRARGLRLWQKQQRSRNDPSNQRKQLMRKGFLHCAIVLVLAMCGIAPATAQFPAPPPLPTPPAEAQPVPAPPKGKKAPAPANSSIVELERSTHPDR